MKKILVSAAALLLASIMLLTGCNPSNVVDIVQEIANGDISDEAASDNTSTDASATAATDTTISAEEPDNDPENASENSALAIQWELAGTWKDGDSFCGGYNAFITNTTDETIESWTVEFAVPKGFEFSAQWNGIFEVSSAKVTINNESYNGRIESGQTASFGFNYKSPEEFEPTDITINGAAAAFEPVITTTPATENTTATITTTTTVTTTQTTTTSQTTTAIIQPTTTTTAKPTAPSDPTAATPVSQHGQLTLNGTQIVDKNGCAYQLKGMSTHGIAWFPDFVNEQAFKTLRDDWNTNVIRLAMYSGESEGYSGSNIAQHEALVKKGIEIAIKLDMYVIVDWHVLADQSPQVRKADALRFFEEISSAYGKYPNLIYEICNEPNGYATWEGDVEPYAEEIIPIIRKNAPNSLIIVGTPTWSQDIDRALANPLSCDNVLYALHFYAATHTDWLRDRVTNCVSKGLPVFVSEFGCCDASGNGANDFNQTRQWLTMLDNLGISYVNWNLANKNETSSAFKSSASANGNWTEKDFSEGGAWIRKWFRGEQ